MKEVGGPEEPTRDDFEGETLGVDPEAKEALAFAVLAWAHLHGVPANAPAATCAVGSRILGSFTPGALDRQGGDR